MEGRLLITHILGGYANVIGSILRQPIDSFLIFPQNECAGVYKSNLSTTQINRLKFFIDSLVTKKITFDLKFDLYHKDKYYCSELIVDALMFASQNKIKFDTSKRFVKNTKYHSIINKDGYFFYYAIDKLQYNKNLRLKKLFVFN